MTSMLFFQLSSPTHWRKEREQGSVLCFVAHWRLNMDKIFYYMFYPQDISSLWADIQSFSTPTLMGVIRGRQWSNKGVRCLLSASKAAILETEIPAGTFLCPVSHKSGCSWHSALLSSSKLHMVQSLWCESHTYFLGRAKVSGMISLLGTAQEVRSTQGHWRSESDFCFFLTAYGENGSSLAPIRASQYISLLICIVLKQGMRTRTDHGTSLLPVLG